MPDSRLPDAVRTLVQEHVPSMAHLEVLLLLVGVSGAGLPPAEVARRARLDLHVAEGALRELAGTSLAVVDETEGITYYRFAPRDDALRRGAEELEEMYRRFPVQVIRSVYDRRVAELLEAADAFRLGTNE